MSTTTPTGGRALAGGVALAVLVGLAAAAGQSGIGWTWVGLAGLASFAWLTATASSWWRALCVAVGFGVGLLAPISAGMASWGLTVPLTFVGLGVGVYAIPAGLWAYWAVRRFASPWTLGAAGACVSLVGQELLDVAGLPYKGEALLLVELPALAAGARLVGSSGIGALLAAGVLTSVGRLVAGSPAPGPAWRRVGVIIAPLALAVTLLLALAGAAHLTAPAAGAPLEVGVPQINVGRDYYEGRLVHGQVEGLFDRRFAALLAQLDGAALVVTTETYDGRFSLLTRDGRRWWQIWARERGQAALVTSFLVDDAARRTNAIAAVDTAGRWHGVHHKVELAPFGEAPLGAGRDHAPLPVDTQTRIGALICNESLLARPGRRLVEADANLLAATVNDVSFGSGMVAFAHLGLTRLRALELGRDMIWASNAGPSGRIDRWGRLNPRAPFRYPAASRFTVERHDDRTPYLTLRPTLPWLCLAMLALLAWRAARPSPLATPALPRRLVRFAPLLAGAAMILLPAATLGSFALVERSEGDARRAWLAVREAWVGQPLVVEAEPYARFRGGGNPDLGAVAYFLAYYGARLDGPLPAAGAPLDELGRSLADSAGIVVARRSRDEAPPPRVAALARLSSGELVVFNQPSATVPVRVVSVERGEAVFVAPTSLGELGIREWLVPAPVLPERWPLEE